MNLQDVKKPEDILNFIEGCLNDMEAGVSAKQETMGNILDLIIHLKIETYDPAKTNDPIGVSLPSKNDGDDNIRKDESGNKTLSGSC